MPKIDAQTVGGILGHHVRNFRSGMERIFLMAFVKNSFDGNASNSKLC